MLPHEVMSELQATFVTRLRLEALAVADRVHQLPSLERELARGMLERRRASFSSGRVAARAALRRLGITGQPIAIGADRAPVWPDGAHGSISHCEDICLVVAGNDPRTVGIGIDIEKHAELGAGVRDLILTSDEKRYLRTLPDGPNWDLLVFSFKESVFKCVNPLIGRWIDFKHASVRFERDDDSAHDRCGVSVRGHCRVTLSASIERDMPAEVARNGRYFATDTHVVTLFELIDGVRRGEGS